MMVADLPPPPVPSTRSIHPPTTWAIWGESVAIVILALAAATIFLSSAIHVSEYVGDIKGFVPRARLGDVRASEFYATTIVGDCRRDTGMIRVNFLGRSSEDAIHTWWHEYFHCFIWPTIPPARRVEWERTYERAVYAGQTDQVSVEEWGADQWGDVCTGKPVSAVVYRQLNLTFSTCVRSQDIVER